MEPKIIIPVKLDESAYLPEKAHEDDAGFDLRTPVSFTLHPNETATIDVGVHMLIPSGYVGLIKSKSGLNVKHNITAEGVIDAGYTGSIKVKAYLNPEYQYTPCEGQDEIISPNDDCFIKEKDGKIYKVSKPAPHTFFRGDKLTQIVIVPIPSIQLQQVLEFPETERADTGFGDSGR